MAHSNDFADRLWGCLEKALVIIGALATIAALIIAFVAFAAPNDVRVVILERNLIGEAPTPQVVIEFITTTPGPGSMPQPTQNPQPTFTMAPSYTPWPTYTPLPTSTPQPTYTPYPTLVAPTPVVKIVTWTPVPSPTPHEQTPADAILEVGEWWKQDGVWLRLADAKLSADGFIVITLEIWNRTENALLFSWSEKDNLILKDNMGHKYTRLTQFADYYGKVVNERVEISERKTLLMWTETMIYMDENYFKREVTDLWLTVMDLSRISHAKWHIPVPK